MTSVRLALEATSGYRAAGAFWRSERRLRARVGGRVGLREHIPDGEVHWPDGTRAGWAGECWAVEAELTRKTVARTAAIMREILTRTGDYGCPAAQARVPGRRRVTRGCCISARPPPGPRGPGQGRARRAGGRVEIRHLPAGAALPARPAAAGDPARAYPGPGRPGPPP